MQKLKLNINDPAVCFPNEARIPSNKLPNKQSEHYKL